MKKISKTLYGIFIAVIGAIALLLLIPMLPIPGNYQVKVVLSGSMEPAIKTGSVIVVKPTSSYEAGDIITFASRSFRGPDGKIIPVTHRVLEVKQEGPAAFSYITKGDANDAQDTNLVRKSDVLGKVLFSTPWVGYAVETARQPYGFLALILIPALIIIYDQITKIWKEVKTMKGKRFKNGDLGLKNNE